MIEDLITVPRLIDAGVLPTQARIFVEPLQLACKACDIDTPARVAAFIAQAVHESRGFTHLEEDLYYRTAARIGMVWPSRFGRHHSAEPYAKNPKMLANFVYANRNGNGDEASGDGWAYRGRGLFGLTGRGNYRRCAISIGGTDYEAEPDRVAEPLHAAITATWYWMDNGINAMADKHDTEAVTLAINGAGLMGLHDRRNLYAQALQAFA